jgi:hypothetical protein
MEPSIITTLQRQPAAGFGAGLFILSSDSTGLPLEREDHMERLTKWVLPAVLALALAFTGMWGYQQYKMNQQYSRHMDNLYQKSFYELVGSVGSVENGLIEASMPCCSLKSVVRPMLHRWTWVSCPYPILLWIKQPSS